jgi:hypothetical protein
MIFAANKLIEAGAANILIKGGHLNSKKVHDIYVNKREIKIFNSKKNKNFKYPWYWLHIINRRYFLFFMWKRSKEIL